MTGDTLQGKTTPRRPRGRRGRCGSRSDRFVLDTDFSDIAYRTALVLFAALETRVEEIAGAIREFLT
jgi:hypothetical protein